MQKQKNFDGIVRHRILVKPTPSAASVFLFPEKPSPKNSKISFWKKLVIQQKVSLAVVMLALLLAFAGGIWVTLSTSKSSADSQPEVLGAFTDQPNNLTVAEATPPSSLGPISTLTNDALFNMTMSQLEDYLNQVAESNRQTQAAQILAQRKVSLKQYLIDKGSPLAGISDTIAELKHWKLVLAISNSESSLGKHCAGDDNNCSGIGVEPGNPLWHTYPNKAEWAKDLDRLIEKRYKDWSLEKMNGVYNHPGSENWLLAAKQILQQLQDRGIE